MLEKEYIKEAWLIEAGSSFLESKPPVYLHDSKDLGRKWPIFRHPNT